MARKAQVTNEETMKVTFRWPKRLVRGLEKVASKGNTSLQTIVTEAVLDKYGIEHWRHPKSGEVEAILDFYKDVPPSLEEAIDKAKRNLIKLNKGERLYTPPSDDNLTLGTDGFLTEG